MKKTLLTALIGIVSIGLYSCNVIGKKEVIFSEKSLFDDLTKIESASGIKRSDIPLAIQKKLNSRDDEHFGIDISHFQGDLIEKLSVNKDSLKFVICKATQGTTFVDPMFRTNWKEIQHRGFIRGAYHFYDCSQDAKTQAQHFSSMISDIQDYDIAPILDIEQGGLTSGITADEVQQQAHAFLQEVERITGIQPVIYSDYGFFQQYMDDPSFSKYNLWLAEYSGNETPLIPTIWQEKGYVIWQKSDHYDVNSTQSDLDKVTGSLKKIIKR